MARAILVNVALKVPNDENDFYSLDLIKLKAAISSKTRMIILNTPNNPTG